MIPEETKGLSESRDMTVTLKHGYDSCCPSGFRVLQRNVTCLHYPTCDMWIGHGTVANAGQCKFRTCKEKGKTKALEQPPNKQVHQPELFLLLLRIKNGDPTHPSLIAQLWCNPKIILTLEIKSKCDRKYKKHTGANALAGKNPSQPLFPANRKVREMAQQLRALGALAEDQGSSLSTCTVVQS